MCGLLYELDQNAYCQSLAGNDQELALLRPEPLPRPYQLVVSLFFNTPLYMRTRVSSNLVRLKLITRSSYLNDMVFIASGCIELMFWLQEAPLY